MHMYVTGAIELSIGMVNGRSLRSVDLSSNGITCEGANALAEAIAEVNIKVYVYMLVSCVCVCACIFDTYICMCVYMI